MFLDNKALTVGIPMWVVSLDFFFDLSKAFDRVHWPALWKSLLEQDTSKHMIWSISKIIRWPIWRGHRIVRSKQTYSNITGGVRQGWVLSPRLFCAALQFAMRKWTICGWHVVFCKGLLDSLAADLSEVGLVLRVDKSGFVKSKSTAFDNHD